jgi:hypothetical protein
MNKKRCGSRFHARDKRIHAHKVTAPLKSAQRNKGVQCTKLNQVRDAPTDVPVLSPTLIQEREQWNTDGENVCRFTNA